MKNKKILCNISGHELPVELGNEMQLVQTYTKILDIFDEVHFICRSINTISGTIKHPTKPIYVHHVKVSNTGIGKTLGAIIKLYLNVLKLNQSHRIDYYIASDTTIGGVTCFLLSFLNRKRYILEVQAEMTRISPAVVGWWTSKAFKWITLFTSLMAYRVRAVSKTVSDQLIADGVNPKKIRIVTSRVKLDKFNFEDYKYAKNEVRIKYNIKDEEKLFIFIGRLVIFKGLTYLLKALSKLDNFKYKLLIVGDGVLKKKLQNEAIDLGIEDNVIFLGAVDFSEVPYFISVGDLIILPSTDEGFPRVMLEAMAMKTLVAGSLVGGVRDIAKDGVNGYFFPSQNPDAILHTIKKIFSEDCSSSCIKNAYELVIEKYEFEVAMKPYLELFREMIT